MNWILFTVVFILGEALVFLQGFASFSDMYFSQAQMQKFGVYRKGYSFLEHGGMWADALIITPLVAYLMAKYQFPYFSSVSIYGILISAFVIWVALFTFIYTPAGKSMPEAHTHDGYRTVAGDLLIIYATIATWIITMVYIPGLTAPAVSKWDIIIVSGLLVPWAVTGVMKFASKWKWNRFLIAQVAVEVVGIAILVWWRL